MLRHALASQQLYFSYTCDLTHVMQYTYLAGTQLLQVPLHIRADTRFHINRVLSSTLCHRPEACMF